jgi:alpha-L-fucosidase
MNAREGIHMLVDIVAKGGNLLLNIAPGPDGKWQQGAYDLLKSYGDWMKINAEGIYNSKPLLPYKENNICITQQDDGTTYFFYLADEDENQIPKEIIVKSHQPTKTASVTLLGSGKKLKWQKNGEGFIVTIPNSLRNKPPCDYAWTIKVSEIN